MVPEGAGHAARAQVYRQRHERRPYLRDPGDKAGAVAAYKEVLRIQREDWGIVSGEERDEVERAIRKLM